MARMAAENMRSERESYVKNAIKANRPLPEIAADFDMPLDEVIALMTSMNTRKEDDLG